jgi:hypothetical protein
VRTTARPPELRLKSDTLAEAMAFLDKGLAKWFKKQGIEVKGRE